jgi:ribonuclease BN (tRNA processing enzyme)
MKITFGGVRGSCPVAQSDFMQFGGETTSVLVQGKCGEQIVIDAGSGVRELGKLLADSGAGKDVLMLFTHLHLDHVMGLPSLPLIYSPEWSFEFASPAYPVEGLADALRCIINPPYWPLKMEELSARLRFRSLGADGSSCLSYGNLKIRWCSLEHPGGCHAYRVDEPSTGASVVFASDVEWGNTQEARKAELFALCASPHPARLLVMDGQYLPKESSSFVGWGHSTWQEVADVAEHCGILQALITHHDPDRNDEVLEQVRGQIQMHHPWMDLARDHMCVVLDEGPTQC